MWTLVCDMAGCLDCVAMHGRVLAKGVWAHSCIELFSNVMALEAAGCMHGRYCVM
jgi:hypothetical protein